MAIDITSRLDCEQLLDRIRRTMLRNGYAPNMIQRLPAVFCENDDYILEGLAKAILTRQANWSTIRPILRDLKSDFSGYKVDAVAALPDQSITELHATYRNRVSAWLLGSELMAIRDNARRFQLLSSKHGPIWKIMRNHLRTNDYDPSLECYIRPQDDDLIHRFADAKGELKLSLVGLAICCEFFNNIGVDEFKPDLHATRFLKRIDLDLTRCSIPSSDAAVRGIGITIAQTTGKPRKLVDSHIWLFCAKGEAEVCEEKDPNCDHCLLKTEMPQLCRGWSTGTAIQVDLPVDIERSRRCSLEGDAEKETVQDPSQSSAAIGNPFSEEVPQSHSTMLSPDHIGTPPTREVIVSARIHATDGPGKPRREITKIAEDATELIIGAACPLDLSVVEHKFHASWNKGRTVLWIPIGLMIGQHEYNAILHYREKTQGLWIGSPLETKDRQDKVKLEDPLAAYGFKAEEEVRLRVHGNRIELLESTQTHES
jgi:hypothetical protein